MIKLQKNLFEGNYPLSQGFGENPDWYAPFGLNGHNGIDYAIPNGTKLLACLFGNVTEILNDTYGYGLYIKIENDECGVIYAHLQKALVNVGDFVTPGLLIGYSNNTGNSTGPHLHFGVFPKPRNRDNGYGGYIDPLDSKNVEWVDKLERPDEFEDEPCDQLVADLRASRRKWKEKVYALEDQIVTERKDHEKEIKKLKAEVSKLKAHIEASNQIGETDQTKEEKGVIQMAREVLWEAVKEPLRLLLLALIPFALSYFHNLPYEWAGLLILVLRFLDKWLHEVGKAREDARLVRGITRF